jgi:hypothetical protein
MKPGPRMHACTHACCTETAACAAGAQRASGSGVSWRRVHILYAVHAAPGLVWCHHRARKQARAAEAHSGEWSSLMAASPRGAGGAAADADIEVHGGGRVEGAAEQGAAAKPGSGSETMRLPVVAEQQRPPHSLAPRPPVMEEGGGGGREPAAAGGSAGAGSRESDDEAAAAAAPEALRSAVRLAVAGIGHMALWELRSWLALHRATALQRACGPASPEEIDGKIGYLDGSGGAGAAVSISQASQGAESPPVVTKSSAESRALGVSHFCACIGSPCLRQCVHGASI